MSIQILIVVITVVVGVEINEEIFVKNHLDLFNIKNITLVFLII
jgi:hypothetical protein